MSEVVATIVDQDPALESHFVEEMVRQMRAIDTYGTYDGWPVARILSPFVLDERDEARDPDCRRPR